MADPTKGEAGSADLKSIPLPADMVTDLQELPEDDVDPDQLAARQAREELEKLEAEESGEPVGQPQSDPAPEPAPAADPEPEPAPAAEPEPKGDDQPAEDVQAKPGDIPYQRFAEKVREANDLRTENAYLRGVAQTALATGQKPSEDGQPGQQATQPTGPDADIETARQAKLKAADDFDSGVITARQLEEERQKQDDIIAQATTQKQAAAQPAPAPEYSLADTQTLEAQAKDLAAKHPYTAHFTNDPDMRRWLITQAYAEAEADGTPIERSAAGTFELRRRFAELSDVHGPRKFPDVDVKATPQPSEGDKEGKKLSEKAQQRDDKLKLQAGHPPDTSQLGSQGKASAEITADQINSMSDDDLAELKRTNPVAYQKYLE